MYAAQSLARIDACVTWLSRSLILMHSPCLFLLTHGAVVGRRFRSVMKLTTKVRIGRGYLWGSFRLLPQRSKHPRERVITPKASTSILASALRHLLLNPGFTQSGGWQSYVKNSNMPWGRPKWNIISSFRGYSIYRLEDIHVYAKLESDLVCFSSLRVFPT